MSPTLSPFCVPKTAGERKLQSIEPSQEADWVEAVLESNGNHLNFFQECTPAYYNAEGKPDSGEGFLHDQYGGGMKRFEEFVDKWLDDGMPGTLTT